jgi:formylglycine-generating enzyme required for sulfatase activity
MPCLLAALMVFCHLGCDNRPPVGSSADQAGLSAPPQTELVPLTNMVRIPAGIFIRLGHPVTISRDFWLSKFEVTQGEYEAIMGTNPSHFTGDPNRPVERVSYFKAVAYCAALTSRERQAGRLPAGYEYRLPTEAEWEYACRAGTTNWFSFDEAVAEADLYAWTAENSGENPQPVGLKQPNPWGLHDMHGNVWEWCLDWFGAYPKAPVTDPTGPPQGEYKVFRGGSWYHDVEFARSANRFMMSPSNGIHFVGFRVALAATNSRE